MPERLLDGGGATEFERRLLSALAAERPAPSLRAHIHRALELVDDDGSAPVSRITRRVAG